jgi:hypothetical protein
MALGYSEISASGKVLPTPLVTSTEGGLNKQLTADAMKGGKKSRKTAKKPSSSSKKKAKRTRKTVKKSVFQRCKSWFFL